MITDITLGLSLSKAGIYNQVAIRQVHHWYVMVLPKRSTLLPIEWLLAHLVHGLLYLAMFILPISGLYRLIGRHLNLFGIEIQMLIPKTMWR